MCGTDVKDGQKGEIWNNSRLRQAIHTLPECIKWTFLSFFTSHPPFLDVWLRFQRKRIFCLFSSAVELKSGAESSSGEEQLKSAVKLKVFITGLNAGHSHLASEWYLKLKHMQPPEKNAQLLNTSKCYDCLGTGGLLTVPCPWLLPYVVLCNGTGVYQAKSWPCWSQCTFSYWFQWG